MKRLVSAVALASALFAAIPAQPAAADHECKVYAIPPYMTNYKTETVAGGILAECEQKMNLIRVEGNVELWSSRTSSWAFAGAADHSEANVKVVYGEAPTSCRGMGNASYRTAKAQMTGLWAGAPADKDGPKTSPYYNTFDCTVDLRDIVP